MMKTTHGYVNVAGDEGHTSPVVYDHVQEPEERMGNSEALDHDEHARSLSPCAPPLYDEIDITKLAKASVRVTTQDKCMDSPRLPRMMCLESGSPTPSAIAAYLCNKEGVVEYGSSPPPPIPARNYLDDDVLTGTKRAACLVASPAHSPLPPEPGSDCENESPPPIPTRTSLREQLLSPLPMEQLDPHPGAPTAPDSSCEANRPDGGRYIISEDGTRHFILYEDRMAYAELKVTEQKKHPMSEIGSRPLPPSPAPDSSNLESAEVLPVKSYQHAAPSQPSDRRHVLGSDNPHEYQCLEETNLDHGVAALLLKEADEANRQPDAFDLTPPSPVNPFSRQLVPAYEVVPLGGNPAVSNVDESGYMEVGHLHQNIHAKQTALKHENPQDASQQQPPQLPERVIKRSSSLREKQKVSLQQKAPLQSSPSPKKNSSKTFGFWSRKRNADEESPVKQDTQASGTEYQYDKLQHTAALMHLNATLPRNVQEPGYSSLNLSDEAVLLRSGVTLRRTIVSIADSVDLKLDLDELNVPVPLIHAPNAPTANIQRRLHTYEDCDIDGKDDQKDSETVCDLDAPSLVWDNSDLPAVVQLSNKVAVVSPGGSPAAKQSQGKIEKSRFPPVVQKPEGVSDEDYERRLQRLHQHEYPELDILEWPTGGDERTPPMRRASEIKAVARESWMSEVQSQEGLPPGWKQEVNEQGQVFYWHIPTGNIQYVRPESNSALKVKVRSAHQESI